MTMRAIERTETRVDVSRSAALRIEPRPMPRDLRRFLFLLFAVALVLDVGIAGWLAWTFDYGSGEHENLVKKGHLVQIRAALFTRFTSDLATFAPSPDELARHGFVAESPEAVEAWRRTAFPQLPYLNAAAIAALPADLIPRARAIAMLYSVNGNRGPICGGFPNLVEQLRGLPQGFGCCSDHAEAFLALGEALGLDVRETYTSLHSFNEFWDPAKHKWIFIDSQFALMAKDPDGTYLSAFEIRERLRTGQKFDYDFFGKPVHWFATHDPRDMDFYRDIRSFANLRVVWGNDIIRQDAFETRTAFLPRPVRNLIGHWLGVMPARVMYVDASADEPELLHTRKHVIYALVLGLPLATCVPPLILWRRRTQRRLHYA
jgi:hypothetical protein